mmetsp:Transcript_1289/g.2632  ORF Transcript_1289/g.2632 Transcript_1289/m.2632 type:complete len:230 (+) Transcript_1289:420-1109(+)
MYLLSPQSKQQQRRHALHVRRRHRRRPRRRPCSCKAAIGKRLRRLRTLTFGGISSCAACSSRGPIGSGSSMAARPRFPTSPAPRATSSRFSSASTSPCATACGPKTPEKYAHTHAVLTLALQKKKQNAKQETTPRAHKNLRAPRRFRPFSPLPLAILSPPSSLSKSTQLFRCVLLGGSITRRTFSFSRGAAAACCCTALSSCCFRVARARRRRALLPILFESVHHFIIL